MNDGRKLERAEALRFVLAGNATVTLRNAETGNRFTYRVQAPAEQRPGQPVWFVKLLSGPDNEGDYVYMGAIFGGSNFRATRASRVSSDAQSFKAFSYVFDRLAAGAPLPESVEIWHEGRCGRCGRLLTVPESIDRGIGPECAGIMGLAA